MPTHLVMPVPAIRFPQCSRAETHILQLRARGHSFRRISVETGIGPRRVSDIYFAAMRKVVRYMEQDAFLRMSGVE